MYYYLFKKLYHVFFPKEEKKELTIIIPDNLNISNHHPFESCSPIRRMAITRKAFEDFEDNDKKEIRNDFKKLFK
jgi:hypothetical protein